MRTHTRFGVVPTLTIAMLGVIVPASSGRAQILRPEGAAEQVGGVVGGALDTAGRAVERSLRTAFSRTRGAVESMEVTARVYSRLHWDRDLTGSRLYLEARPGGVVLLRGTVPSREAADRAVALAASTVGVSRVVSELVSPEPATVVDPIPSTIPLERSPLPEVEPEPGLEPLPRIRPTPTPEPAPTSDPEPTPVPEPSIRPPLP